MSPTSRKPDAVLLRHFATRLNESGVSRGHLPVGIDKEAAEKLAPGVAATLDRYGITKLISSDLPRASQSAKLVAEKMASKPKVESTDRLETWDVGDMAGQKEAQTIPKREKYIKYADETPPGGEAFEDFIKRYRSERDSILQPNTAFVAHGHHLLAASAVLGDKQVDPAKLASLDEDHPPGTVWGFWIDGNNVRTERLDDGPDRFPQSS